MTKKMVSPSRQYVAILNKSNFDGYRFRRFELPETAPSYMGFRPMLNNADQAAWYFLNVLDHTSCLENCCPLEDFGDAGQYLERQAPDELRGEDGAVQPDLAGGSAGRRRGTRPALGDHMDDRHTCNFCAHWDYMGMESSCAGVRIEGKCGISRKLRLEHDGSLCPNFQDINQKGTNMRFVVTTKMEVHAVGPREAEAVMIGLLPDSHRPLVRQVSAERIKPSMREVTLEAWTRAVQYGNFAGKDDIGLRIVMDGVTYCWVAESGGPYVITGE